jgi:hypothetical protein
MGLHWLCTAIFSLAEQLPSQPYPKFSLVAAEEIGSFTRLRQTLECSPRGTI